MINEEITAIVSIFIKKIPIILSVTFEQEDELILICRIKEIEYL